MYYEISITPANAGFGEYQTSPVNGDGWADEYDLEMAMRGNADLYELGVDELPEGVDDIRGRIHNEPGRVFAAVGQDGMVAYTGIVEFGGGG